LQILGFFFFEKKKELKKKKRRRRRRRRGDRGVAGATPCQEMGWPDHPIFGQGVTEPAVWGWPKPPQAFGGGPATPKGQKKKKKKRKNGFEILGVAGPPPRAWGWLRPTPWPKMGWSGHPISGQGVAPATLRFPLLFFFFFPSFFQKKKKKKLKLKPKIPKTTPFWAHPKRRSFGVNGSLDNLPPKGS
jgi:hypothetical protein